MRILVTGGTGVVGTQFAAAAVARGHSLLSLSRRAPAHPRPGITYASGSVAFPPWELLAAFRPEICIHLAWIAIPGAYLESPENRDWVSWSESFLLALRDLGVRKFVVAGTCAEYGVTGEHLNEEGTPTNPLSLYARCKVELHARLKAQLSGPGITFSWARLFYPYGETEHPGRLASTLAAQLLRGKPVELRTPGSIKDFIHLEDVGSAILKVAEQDLKGPINVGTGVGVSVEFFARRIAQQLGRPELVCLAPNPSPDPLNFMVADASRLRSLGWFPKVSLETGVHRFVKSRTL